MPQKAGYSCERAIDIQNHINNNEIFTYIYTIMAQPIDANSPSFCVLLFGTTNSFTAKDILKRWAYMEKEFQEEGIEVVAICSDGDTRLLKAMKISCQDMRLMHFESSKMFLQLRI